MTRRRQVSVTWTGQRPPTAAQKRAIARGVEEGTIRDGARLGPALAARANPSRVGDAVVAYREFHWGNDPKRVSKKKLPNMGVLFELGKVRAVEYEADKGGEHAIWVHEFTRPYPSLTATPEGKLGPIVGGRAVVTPRGIER